MGLRTIGRGILLFWAIWFTIVFTTNACDALKALGVLPKSWLFASGNVDFMLGVTGRYGTPVVLTGLLFAGVVLWEAVAAALTWRAFARAGTGGAPAREAAYAALGTGVALWAAFAVADELFIAYTVEGTHISLFVAQLASLIFLACVPGALGDD